MTAPEKIQIRELKNQQAALLRSQEDFHDEIRGEIQEIKATLEGLSKLYIPQSWVTHLANVVKWVIGTTIALVVAWGAWRHK